VQGGGVLQPVALYAAGDGKTYRDCLVVTGAATVAPDAETGAAVFFCRSLVLDGAAASLTAGTNCKGLLGFAQEGIVLLNGAKVHMNALGRAGNFGDLAPAALIPVRWRGRVVPGRLAAWTAVGEGAAGAARKVVSGAWSAGNTGAAAPDGSLRTGGGGSGTAGCSVTGWSGSGGKGGPCCGGAGSGAFVGEAAGSSGDAGDSGGPGSAGAYNTQARGVGGGAGDPAGASNGGAAAAGGAGGGLLMLFAPRLSIASGCIVSADGAAGGNYATGNGGGGGGAGGGCVCLVTSPGGYANGGTVRASGGSGGAGSSGYNGGPGGVGSVNTFAIN
jgi:hypothetical protein